MRAKPARVLLVEDNPGDARLVRHLLDSDQGGFELAVVRTFREALSHAHESGCDIILLDLGLPDSFGVQGVKELALALPRTPIMVLTGLDDERAAIEALCNGAQDYLVKGASDPLPVIRAIRYAIARKAFEGLLAERAHFDFLTGLVNRALFQDRLGHGLTRAVRSGKSMALMFIDLDGFKAINDALGHEVGDQVLKAAARLLGGVARKGDTVARLGGDEFAILLEEIGEARDAALASARILRAFEEPLPAAAKPVLATCSIGISIFPASAADAEALFRNADAAMFEAKKAGRNTVRFFS